MQSKVPRKTSESRMVASVPQTDTGGRGEYPQANEPIFVQELGKKAAVP